MRHVLLAEALSLGAFDLGAFDKVFELRAQLHDRRRSKRRTDSMQRAAQPQVTDKGGHVGVGALVAKIGSEASRGLDQRVV